MRQNPNENHVKNKIKIDRSEYNPVPLYRSYGVTSKEYPLLTKIKSIIQKALATVILIIPISAAAVGILAFILVGGPLVSSAIVLPLLVFTFLKLTKPLRKRAVLIGKLKKLCKKDGYKSGYSLEMSDGILSSNWANGKGELVFHTNTRVYHIRIFSMRKYRSRIRFESENELTVIKPPLRNKFSTIYDLKEKRRTVKIDFSQITDLEGKETVKALIFCPTCEEWYYRHSANSYVPTGNAETVFGYKVYTSSGFISDMTRSEEV